MKFAVAQGLPSMYVTEDTVRTDPETVQRLYSTAIRSGARAIVLCDTVGSATPQGAFHLVRYVMENVVKPSGTPVAPYTMSSVASQNGFSSSSDPW